MYNQVEELMTQYGKIDIAWFDFSYPAPSNPTPEKQWMKGKGKDDWEAEKLIAMVRKHQPDIIINNRTEVEQDLWTPEQIQVTEWPRHSKTGELVTWEACHTFSGSWGYHRDEMTWKTPRMLLELLIDTVALGGNMIMNVGPTARGYLDYRAVEGLKVYADWMKYNSRSIYGCTMAEPELEAPFGCRYTQSQDGKRLYVHLIKYPVNHLVLPGLRGKVEYAQFLHDGSEIKMKKEDYSNVEARGRSESLEHGTGIAYSSHQTQCDNSCHRIILEIKSKNKTTASLNEVMPLFAFSIVFYIRFIYL